MEKNYKEIIGLVRREGQEKPFRTRIGTAFENKDGSWNLLFDYLPTSAETGIQLRSPRPKAQQTDKVPAEGAEAAAH